MVVFFFRVVRVRQRTFIPCTDGERSKINTHIKLFHMSEGLQDFDDAMTLKKKFADELSKEKTNKQNSFGHDLSVISFT